MEWKKEWKPLVVMAVVFLAVFYLPVGRVRFDNALLEGFHLIREYAREHVVLCLIPAFFIAGAISVFLSKASVMKYLGAHVKKVVSYTVASVSGSILAVCSCTVLPLFAGIYRMGAGIGPATAFLYSGPAINILAIILTARVLGIEIGVARAVGAVVFSVIIGLMMQFIFRKDEKQKEKTALIIETRESSRPAWQTILYFVSMIGVLVFANWGASSAETGLWNTVYEYKWIITSLFAVSLGLILAVWFRVVWWKLAAVAGVVIIISLIFPASHLITFSAGIVGISIVVSTNRGEAGEWFESTFGFAKQILPLLFAGVLIAGMLLGRPEHEGLIPSGWVSSAVGGNSIMANLFASIAGAFMYFATLTEIPILQGLLGAGMGKGPALALLLAGPALSLPNMLVIRSIIGTLKTVVFVSLVVVMATISGIIFGIMTG